MSLNKQLFHEANVETLTIYEYACVFGFAKV